MSSEHDAVGAVRREFSDWRPWITRALVLAFAALAGLSIVGFTWLTDLAFSGFRRIAAVAWWLPLVWTPLATAACVWLTRRYAAGAAGSGIPQVMAALDTAVAAPEVRFFVSLRLAAAKVFLTAWGLLAGLSLGREGPSVQIAAGVLHSVRRWLPERTAITEHGLLVAGGAAGIAAAFNAPLAGVMFAIEELSRRPEQRSSGLLVAAIVLAGLMAVSAYGNSTYFGVIQVPTIGWSLLGPGVLVALLGGVAGGVFSRLLLASLSGGADRINVWRARHPIAFAAICGLAVAVVALATSGATSGSGYDTTRQLLAGTQNAPVVYALGKLVATWLTVWSGVPAGIFAPSLAIGAGIGNDVALLVQQPDHAALIALGMVAFLAATTQAPLTAFIIVMEMIDGHAMVLSLMACALIASLISRLLGPALYAALAQVQLRRLRPAIVAAPAVEESSTQAAVPIDSAKREGDLSMREGESAKGEGDSPKAEGGSAERDGNSAKRESENVKLDGDNTQSDGDSAKPIGDDPKPDGDKPKRDGDIVKRDGDSVKRDGDSVKPEVDGVKPEAR